MQDSITLGETLNFATYVPDYVPDDGWTLKYRLVPRSTGSVVALTTTQDTEDTTRHRVQATAAETAAWVAGTYSWSSWVEKAAEVYGVASGVVKLLPDPRTATTLDTRTDNAIALDNVRALIQGKATSGVLSYRIGERQLQTFSMAELIQLESRLATAVQAEQNCANLAAGLKSNRKVHVRLGRV